MENIGELSDVILYGNKVHDGIISFEYDDAIFNMKLVKVGEDKHYLKAHNLNEDKVFTSDDTINKRLSDFLEYVDESNKEKDVQAQLDNFLKVLLENKEGKLQVAEYKVQCSLMVKLQIPNKQLVYACILNTQLTSKSEHRDKKKNIDIDIYVPDISNKIKQKTHIDENEVLIGEPGEQSQVLSKEVTVQKIKEMFTKYDLVKVNQLIETGLASYPDDLDILEFKAEYLNQLRRGLEAVAVCDSVLSKDPTRNKARAEKALAWRQLYKLKEGLELIDQVLKEEPKNERYLYIKAFILNCMTKVENELALPVINKALEINPESPLLYTLKGMIYSDMKMNDEALTFYNKSLILNPRYVVTYNYIGMIYKSRDKLDEAKKIYQKGIEVDPTFTIGYTGLGECLLKEYKYDEAKPYFEKAIEIDPNNTNAMIELAKAYYQQYGSKEKAKALVYVDKALEIEPELVEGWFTKGDIYFSMGKYKDALPWLKKAADFKQNVMRYLLAAGNCCLKLDEKTDAYEYFELGTLIDPNNWDANTGMEYALRG